MATGRSNFNAWRFKIIRILKEKSLLSAIESDTDSVSTAKDNQAFTIITLNIKDSQIPHIQDCTTAKEAWNALKKVHQGIGANSRMVLMQRLWALRMSDGNDMAEHLNQFRELANQVQGLSGEGKGIDDSELVTILSLSLPSTFEPLVMALQSRSEEITFDVFAGRLLQESARRQVGQAKHQPESGTRVQQTAFTARRFDRNTTPQPRGIGRGNHRGRPSPRGIGGGRGGRSNMGASRGAGGTETRCFYCGKIGHWKKDCFKKKSEDAQQSHQNKGGDFTFMANTGRSGQGSSWIIDSGASQHLCGERSQFITYQSTSYQRKITIADGSKIDAIGIGDVKLRIPGGFVMLQKVWHVPEIGGNLLSVSRMIDCGYSVKFKEDQCYVSSGMGKFAIGERQERLYYLKEADSTTERSLRESANLGLITNQVVRASMETWHRRLGHRTLNKAAVQYISSHVRQMDILPERESEDQICDICAKGRQHKESATGTREKAQEILEVVHSDICGPMQVTTLNGQRYFITFIDEMSGRVGIALLHRKSDAMTAFKGYQSRAERSSGKKIQALRSDGGGEYTSREFAEHLKLEGIKHIVSPPYNPRQNGLAERMNRTIMETARCLLEDSKLGKE